MVFPWTPRAGRRQGYPLSHCRHKVLQLAETGEQPFLERSRASGGQTIQATSPPHCLGKLVGAIASEQAEAALTKTEGKLCNREEITGDWIAAAAEGAKIAFWREEAESGSYVWLEAADKVLGRPAGELPVTDGEYLKLVHHEDVERVEAAYVQSRRQAKDIDLEYRILRSDGTFAWLHEIGEVDQQRADGSFSFAESLQDITQSKTLEARLELLAAVDELTGAYNRRSILAQAEVELRWARRFNRPLAFLFLDIDHFKQVNDRFGHKIGDLVLSTFSDVCRNALRPSDMFARIGGEEFLVMLPETGLAGAIAAAQRVAAHLRQAVFSVNPPVRGLTTSMGVTAIRGADDTIEAARARIDRALYRAKELGRDRIEAEA
jgi:diguanylate cyclase (GGDEF)-like protein